VEKDVKTEAETETETEKNKDQLENTSEKTEAGKDENQLHCKCDSYVLETDVHFPSEIVDTLVMPKKGRLNKSDAELENSEEFIRIRKKHSGVESAINALENHGLDRCPDHGIDVFKRYVSLGILARNIQKLGQVIQKQEQKKQSRKKKIQETWNRKKAA
jgi:hypothetical protein